MKKILCVVCLMLLSTNAVANENDLRITTFIGSYHFDRDAYQCEINPGIGFQYFTSDTFNIQFGVYRNSPCNTAMYATAGWETDTSSRFGCGLQLGLVSGYDKDEDFSTAPLFAFPYIRFGSSDNVVQTKLIILPVANGMVGLAFSWKIR